MNKRVLIVDDALFMRNYIRGILEKYGFIVVGEATTAPEAVKLFSQEKPDLVTMDLIMPQIEEMDGIKAVQEIKKIDPEAKIVVISAIGEDHLVKEALKCGASGFIIKPFKEEQVIDVIRSVML